MVLKFHKTSDFSPTAQKYEAVTLNEPLVLSYLVSKLPETEENKKDNTTKKRSKRKDVYD